MGTASPPRTELFGTRPALFAEEILGVTPWPHQGPILQALAGGKRLIAVRSCNAAGKEFVAACAALWAPACWDDVAAITTGPTWHQQRDIVWGREIHNLWLGARIRLPGRLLDTEWDISPTRRAVALSTVTKEALQGIHARDMLLIIVDEASAQEITAEMWEALFSLMASGRAILLALGNPTRNEGQFYKAYGEESDYYRVHVMGDFPQAGANTLIPLSWIEAACQRERRSAGSSAPLVAGLDVARHGMDQSALAVVCDAHLVALEQWSDRSLMGTVGRTLAHIRDHQIRIIAVDDTNLQGVSDRLIEVAQTEKLDLLVLPINWSSKAGDQRIYHNKPSEMWARLRDNLSPEAPQPLSLAIGDRQLAGQLSAQLSRATYKFDSYGMGRLWSSEE